MNQKDNKEGNLTNNNKKNFSVEWGMKWTFTKSRIILFALSTSLFCSTNYAGSVGTVTFSSTKHQRLTSSNNIWCLQFQGVKIVAASNRSHYVRPRLTILRTPRKHRNQRCQAERKSISKTYHKCRMPLSCINNTPIPRETRASNPTTYHRSWCLSPISGRNQLQSLKIKYNTQWNPLTSPSHRENPTPYTAPRICLITCYDTMLIFSTRYTDLHSETKP